MRGEGRNLREVAPGEVPVPLFNRPDGMSIASQEPPSREEALDPHGTSGMDTGGADAHLSSKAITEPIGESRTRVMEDRGAVHTS